MCQHKRKKRDDHRHVVDADVSYYFGDEEKREFKGRRDEDAESTLLYSNDTKKHNTEQRMKERVKMLKVKRMKRRSQDDKYRKHLSKCVLVALQTSLI